MRLVVFSHKVCRPDPNSPSGYATDGGFPLHMEALSQLFDATRLVVPCQGRMAAPGDAPLKGKCLQVVPVPVPFGRGLVRKVLLPWWFLRCAPTLFRETLKADAVHAPIPGDVGTIGFALALLLRKPLFVRHCGNWLVQKTLAERMWRWAMERYAGGRNVMLATGGGTELPSVKNRHIQWIFSSSLWARQMDAYRDEDRPPPSNGCAELVIACRQDEAKGTGVVIQAMPAVLRHLSHARLHVIGDGPALARFKELAHELNVEGSVLFHGRLPHAKVLEVVKDCHVFCYPTSASEGFPKVVLEALACGVPVIATRVSVLPYLLKDGGGVLLNEGSPQELAEAVVKLLADGNAYRQACNIASATARSYTLEAWRDAIGFHLRRAWGRLAKGDEPVCA